MGTARKYFSEKIHWVDESLASKQAARGLNFRCNFRAGIRAIRARGGGGGEGGVEEEEDEEGKREEKKSFDAGSEAPGQPTIGSGRRIRVYSI